MIQKFGVQQYSSIQLYETNKKIVEESMLIDLKLRVEREGYAIKAEPTIRIAGYVKITESGFIPTDKESADLVDIFLYAEGVKL